MTQENCRSCHGRGYWLVSGVRKDGQPSKRRVRCPCTLCRETGKRDAAIQQAENAEFLRQQEQRKSDGIPF